MSNESTKPAEKPTRRHLRLEEREEAPKPFLMPDDYGYGRDKFDGPSTVAGYFEMQGIRSPKGA